MAEEEGFEPPVPCGTHDFESRAFNHSAIPPKGIGKVNIYSESGKPFPTEDA